jgi:hypothetical protein
MEALSPELADRLLALGLCRARDLARCRRQVRRLTRDLPAFDSVWLDALVQLGRLTPFQARVLAESPDGLAVGPFLVVDQLPGDGRLTRQLARHRESDQLCELWRTGCEANRQAEALNRLRDVIARGRTIASPQLALPTAANPDSDGIVVTTPHCSGVSLRELLVRRGRFPIPVVQEVLRQLAEGCVALERAGLVHGDLRLRTVLLGERGDIVMLAPGLWNAIQPTVETLADATPESLDGSAPELIDTRAERTPQSDLYAIGCLVWELIAGRPPFPAGDSLLKLAAHRTRPVPDVRTWNPETPAGLAELIAGLTAHSPADRPRSFRDVLARCRRGDAGRLARFVKTFQSAAPRSMLPTGDEPRTGRRITVAAVAALVLFGGTLMHRGARAELLRIVHEVRSAAQRPVDLSPEQAAVPDRPQTGQGSGESSGSSVPGMRGATTTLLPLPAADPQGVVTLTEVGPYAAGSIAAIGPLKIVAAAGVRPVIEVSGASLELSGTVVILEGVTVRRGAGKGTDHPLLSVAAREFGLVGTVLTEGDASRANGTAAPPLIVWTNPDSGGDAGVRLGWVDAQFFPAGDVIECRSPLRSVHLRNSLQVGGGALFRFEGEASSSPTRIQLKQVTLRESGGILSLPAIGGDERSAVSIVTENCLFWPTDNSGLLEVRNAVDTTNGAETLAGVSLTGAESGLRTGSPLATGLSGGERVRLDDDTIQVEGLRFVDTQFAGPATSDWTNSRIHDGDAALSHLDALGFQPTGYFDIAERAYNSPTEEPTQSAARDDAANPSAL